MIRAILLDAGPLVAFLAKNEEYHHWVTDRFKELPPCFLTCEAVLTEACFLLGFSKTAMNQIEKFLCEGWIQSVFQFSKEHQAVMALMRQYRNIPMSFADACLVRMAELNDHSKVLTLDGHFRVYRKNGRHAIPLIIPN